jgi:hypothetical protein
VARRHDVQVGLKTVARLDTIQGGLLIAAKTATKNTRRKEGSMKRLSYLVLTGLLMGGFSLHALSQSTQKPADPCAQFKTAPKGETAADKKKRRAELKACTDKAKADAKASQQTQKKGAK